MKKTYITPGSTIVTLMQEDAVLVNISMPQDEETADGDEALSNRKSIWSGNLWDGEE